MQRVRGGESSTKTISVRQHRCVSAGRTAMKESPALKVLKFQADDANGNMTARSHGHTGT